MHLSSLTSHNLLFFRFCKTSKKTIFSGFLSFFLVKLSQSQSLKLNISRTTWPILMILVSFCRILNGFSDEINLLWRCSSPLTLEPFHLGSPNFLTSLFLFFTLWTYCGEISGKLIFQGGCCSNFQTRGHEKSGV